MKKDCSAIQTPTCCCTRSWTRCSARRRWAISAAIFQTRTRPTRGPTAWCGYRVHNLDALICAQAPKMAPHIETMRANIARALQLDVDAVNVKATTTERLGFVGDGSGISAYAVCLLEACDA